MGKGKMCAQSGHAAVGLYQRCVKRCPDVLRRWERSGQRKIAVKINGDFGSLSGTEKIKAIPGNDGTTRLLGAKAPQVYSFASSDNWTSASFKTFSRKGFEVNSLTTVFEYGTTAVREIG